MVKILEYIDTALNYADKYKDLIKIGGSAGKAYLDYKNQKELNELTEDAYRKYMQEQQAAGQEAQAAVDINLTPMTVTGVPKSKADVTDFTALAARGGIIGLKNGGDPNAGITALRKKAPGVVKRMGFEDGSNEDGVAIQEAEGETVSFGTYDGNISFPRKENESQEMAILNGLFNDVEGKVDEETKMQYYKILIPQVYKNGEISKDVYEKMIQEIIVNKAKGGIANLKNGGFPDLNKDGKVTKADVLKGRGVFNMGGGVMDLGGMEKDYRFNGGFVPIGEYEKKDDVPARLSKNEFVFTADAVRAAGGGRINKGAKRMYDTMKKLEAKPTAKRMTA